MHLLFLGILGHSFQVKGKLLYLVPPKKFTCATKKEDQCMVYHNKKYSLNLITDCLGKLSCLIGIQRQRTLKQVQSAV